MAEQSPHEQMVSVEELTLSNSFEIAALIAVLERKGILTHVEVLDEIARQKKGGKGFKGSRVAKRTRGLGTDLIPC